MLSVLPRDVMERAEQRLRRLYGDASDRLLYRLVITLDRYAARGTGPPRASRWDQEDVLLITYGDSILGEPHEAPLDVLRRFALEFLADAVSIIHLLPFFPYSSDDGFSVIDYRSVNPALGGWPEIAALGDEFDLMFDLVLNHVSSRSAWFRDFRRGVAPARDYFVEVDPEVDLSAVVRPRSLPLLTPAHTPQGERQVWTTFSEDQMDVDFGNPDVLFEFIDILLLYLEQGARILRLDAIAYLWKRIGTPCIHLPETHEVVKLLRDVIELIDSDALLLTETNVPHAENVSYFGDGDEAHMVYQFSLPPLVLHALHTGDGRYLRAWAKRLERPPRGCTYLNFTASHDGIGVRPLQGLIPDADLDDLVEAVRRRGGDVSTRQTEDGRHHPYELNITYFDALGGESGTEDPRQVDRFLCSQFIALSLQGIPALYLHSLTGTHNDDAGVKKTGRARSINRKQWSDTELRGLLSDPASETHRVFDTLRHWLATRRGSSAFHPDAPQTLLNLGDAVFAIRRRNPSTRAVVVCVANLTDREASIQVAARGKTRDLIRGELLAAQKVSLKPYQCRWLVPPRSGSASGRKAGGKGAPS